MADISCAVATMPQASADPEGSRLARRAQGRSGETINKSTSTGACGQVFRGRLVRRSIRALEQAAVDRKRAGRHMLRREGRFGEAPGAHAKRPQLRGIDRLG